jgi:glycosyltransferase involved in cell wall biosynthesis
VSILPGYNSLIGAWAKRRFGIPFVLDYQDPWVSEWGARQPMFSKAGISHLVASVLERRVLPTVDALTAVSNGTFDSLKDRNLIPKGVPIRALPIGIEEHDHEVARIYGKSAIERAPGRKELVYLGSVNDGMIGTIKSIFVALRAASESGSALNLRVSFIGTSGMARGADRMGLRAMAKTAGVEGQVQVMPGRIGYLDALRTMQDADALLLAGTEFAHYTASKVFPYWLSGKPVIGLFHERSTVFDIANDIGGIGVIPYGSSAEPKEVVPALTQMFRDVALGNNLALPERNTERFEKYSARAIARQYAEIFDAIAK